jgi:hypothetical protein
MSEQEAAAPLSLGDAVKLIEQTVAPPGLPHTPSVEPPPAEPSEDAPPKSFAEAAHRGERVISINGAAATPAPCACSGCGAPLEPPYAYVALEPDGVSTVDGVFYCQACRASRLGPPCAACGKPVSREDGLLALDTQWHRDCLRCSHPACEGAPPLGAEYYEHKGKLCCRHHYLELAGERCAKCGGIVDGGLRALGRVWHEGCLTCSVSGEPLEPGNCFLDEGGRPVSSEAKMQTEARCHACGKPALTKRLYANGELYHRDCFKCSHCKSLIEEQNFVMHDGEPYLDGCYQKLFGKAAGEPTRVLVQGHRRRYAIHVPLLISLGPSGLATFATQHAELFPAARRLMRQQGILAAQTFIFTPPAVSKPSFFMALEIPTLLDAEEALPQLLRADPAGQAWEQLIAAAHDAPASRNNPWWSTLTQDVVEAAGGAGETLEECKQDDTDANQELHGNPHL